MKNLLLVLALALFAGTIGHAQSSENKGASATSEGSILLGTTTNLFGTNLNFLSDVSNNVGISLGSTKFRTDNIDDDDPTGFTLINISPKAGLFVIDNGLAGIDLSFVYAKGEDDEDPTTSFAVGPFVRYYFNAESFQPFVHAGLSVGQLSFGSDDSDKSNLFQYGIGAGGAFFLGEKVSIDLLLGFNHQTRKDKDAFDDARTINNVFGLAAGLSVFL